MNNGQQEAEPFLPIAAASKHLLLGGSSFFLLNFGRVLGRRGCRLPIIVLTEEVENETEFSSANADVRYTPRKGHIYEDRLAWGYRQLACLRPRAVLACLGSDSFEMLRLVPKGVVRLGIVQSHDPGPYSLISNFVPWLDAVVGVSTGICEHLHSLPECASLRVEHIPYGIDFLPVAEGKKGDAGEPLRVIYLGRVVEPQKRISRIAQLIQLLEQRQANVRFTIVGAGPDEAKFRSAISGCTSVEIRGSVPNAEVASILREQDAFILLSDFEGLPLSLLEAMAEGVVPVVSDLPSGIREVVTPSTGVRVPIGDVEAAARAIEELTSNREHLAALSREARIHARSHYSAERMVERFMSLIEDLDRNPSELTWPNEVVIPTPRMVRHPWLFTGAPRRIRRLVKRLNL